MSEFDDEPTFDGGGYDVDDWARLKPFTGALATLEDVQARVAIFALGDTHGGRPIDMDLPQPIIWWEDEGEIAAVAVQAEAHETEDGEVMEVLGLVLPDGAGAVALLEDVDLVDDSDPVWRRLVTEAIGDETGEDDED
ncbi:hypothetical protein GGQ61_002737 [Phenylobacterium haematophilum]|jgi:hypothetical protein|uniref:Uncharacterized protein n=1 Tax=Phenylobacterium haematophilum TaxID=98513 RepID=A0A840A1Z4_9CAUL|nr:hypothetical protein [Phenylobacterium haematophilum]MBB3892009.1 hypothetical protein [Phenylobacterium haematophilum]